MPSTDNNRNKPGNLSRSNWVDYVVVGAGVAGLATAHWLSDRMPAASVLVLERSGVAGNGTSGRASGWVRSIFGDEHLVELALRTHDLYEEYAASPKTPFELTTRPAVLTLDDEERLARLAARCRRAGRPGLELEHEELQQRLLAWNLAGSEHALWFDDEIQISPLAALDCFWFAAHYNRVRFEFRTEVTTLEELGEGWKIITTRGTFRARNIILAAGHWSQEFISHFPGMSRMHGVLKTAVATAAPVTRRTNDARLPFYAEIESGLAVIPTPQAGRLILTHKIDPTDERLKNDKGVDSIDPWELPRDIGLLPDKVLDAAMDVVPSLIEARVERIWSGVVACTPTGYPMAGRISDEHQPPAWLLSGLSGSGFSLAPSLAELLADQLAGNDVPNWFSQFDPVTGFHERAEGTELTRPLPNDQLLF